ETELLIKLADIRAKKKRARNWKNYLWIALRNHALNLIQRSFHPETVPVDPVDALESDDVTEFIREISLPEKPTEPERALAIKFALLEFNPRLLLLWKTLRACDGSQLLAAKRLRKHPNTIAYGVAQIRKILKRHGLP